MVGETGILETRTPRKRKNGSSTLGSRPILDFITPVVTPVTPGLSLSLNGFQCFTLRPSRHCSWGCVKETGTDTQTSEVGDFVPSERDAGTGTEGSDGWSLVLLHGAGTRDLAGCPLPDTRFGHRPRPPWGRGSVPRTRRSRWGLYLVESRASSPTSERQVYPADRPALREGGGGCDGGGRGVSVQS